MSPSSTGVTADRVSPIHSPIEVAGLDVANKDNDGLTPVVVKGKTRPAKKRALYQHQRLGPAPYGTSSIFYGFLVWTMLISSLATSSILISIVYYQWI